MPSLANRGRTTPPNARLAIDTQLDERVPTDYNQWNLRKSTIFELRKLASMHLSNGNARIVGSGGRRDTGPGLFAIACLAVCVMISFAPTFLKLIEGPWRTEQEGHGPLIILAAAWLVWQRREQLRVVRMAPAPIAGWALLFTGLVFLAICRSQDVLMIEVASQLPILAGCMLLVGGWSVVRILAFPLGFLIFSVPPPGWMMDSFTVPLKGVISDWVAEILYDLDFPVAQNGVMMMIGPYELMVKDACAGMNSIFALSAIGVFYIHEFVRNSWPRAVVLLIAIIPITIAANFLRVVSLVLIAYYFGIDAIEGIFHDLTGFALFVVALAMFFMLDGVLLLLFGAARVLGARLDVIPKLRVPGASSRFDPQPAKRLASSPSENSRI